MNKFFSALIIFLAVTGCSGPEGHSFDFEKEGGSSISISLDPDCSSIDKNNFDSIINVTTQIFESRLSKYGITKFNIVRSGKQIRIEISDEIDKTSILNLLQSRGDIGFYETYTNKEMYTSFLEANNKTRMLFDTDSGFVSMKNEFIKKNIGDIENPLLSLIDLMLDEQWGAKYPSVESSMMGLVRKTDTQYISKFLYHPFIRRSFPNNLQFIWFDNWKDDDVDSSLYISLHMLKTTEHQKPNLLGQHILSAKSEYNSDYATYEINLRFTDKGSLLWKDLTAKNVNREIAVVLDGILIMLPVVQSVILNGNANISGYFSESESKEMASILSSGTLPCKCRTEVEANGPEL